MAPVETFDTKIENLENLYGPKITSSWGYKNQHSQCIHKRLSPSPKPLIEGTPPYE